MKVNYWSVVVVAALAMSKPIYAQEFQCGGWEPPYVVEAPITLSVHGNSLSWSNGAISQRADLIHDGTLSALFTNGRGVIYALHGKKDLSKEALTFKRQPLTIHMMSASKRGVQAHSAECK